MSGRSILPGRWLILPAAATLVLAAGVAWRLNGVGLSGLLAWAPKNPGVAALTLIAAYVLKSLSVVFPISALYLAAGVTFSLPGALAVSLLGIAAGFSVPYLIGRKLGGPLADRLLSRYPRIEAMLRVREGRPVLFGYALRVVGVVPFDIGSLLLGALRVPYAKGLAGSACGLLPGLLAHLLLAEQLAKGFGPVFVALTLAFSAASLAPAYLIDKALGHKKG